MYIYIHININIYIYYRYSIHIYVCTLAHHLAQLDWRANSTFWCLGSLNVKRAISVFFQCLNIGLSQLNSIFRSNFFRVEQF